MVFPLLVIAGTFDASAAALAIIFGLVARMERSEIRGFHARIEFQDGVTLHPATGYKIGLRQNAIC
jgi:hypothetical protein